MRTLKFRMWMEDAKKFQYLDSIFNMPDPSYDGDVQQFTGLLDKSSKKIYEGDIVRILYTDWASKSSDDSRTLEQYLIDIASIGTVVYNAPTFEIDFGIGKYGDNDYGRMNPGTHGYIEIIGNIYENPELLK